MRILTTKYKVLLRLLKSKSNFEDACSKSGASLTKIKKYLKMFL